MGNSPYSANCIGCREKSRERQRRLKGFKPKVSGGKGRPLKKPLPILENEKPVEKVE
jgi:hypothetical protein